MLGILPKSPKDSLNEVFELKIECSLVFGGMLIKDLDP